jgi:hypothetical protein
MIELSIPSELQRARNGLADALTSEFGAAHVVEYIEALVNAIIDERRPIAIIECEDCNARVFDLPKEPRL